MTISRSMPEESFKKRLEIEAPYGTKVALMSVPVITYFPSASGPEPVLEFVGFVVLYVP